MSDSESLNGRDDSENLYDLMDGNLENELDSDWEPEDDVEEDPDYAPESPDEE